MSALSFTEALRYSQLRGAGHTEREAVHVVLQEKLQNLKQAVNNRVDAIGTNLLAKLQEVEGEENRLTSLIETARTFEQGFEDKEQLEQTIPRQQRTLQNLNKNLSELNNSLESDKKTYSALLQDVAERKKLKRQNSFEDKIYEIGNKFCDKA